MWEGERVQKDRFMALGHGWLCFEEAHFDRFGRTAAERVKYSEDRLWLQAVDRRI